MRVGATARKYRKKNCNFLTLSLLELADEDEQFVARLIEENIITSSYNNNNAVVNDSMKNIEHQQEIDSIRKYVRSITPTFDASSTTNDTNQSTSTSTTNNNVVSDSIDNNIDDAEFDEDETDTQSNNNNNNNNNGNIDAQWWRSLEQANANQVYCVCFSDDD